MAPRTIQQVTKDLAEKGVTFDLSPFDAIKLIPGKAGETAYESAVLAYLRTLDKETAEPSVDWVAKFLESEANGKAYAAFKKAANGLADAMTAARKDGSKINLVLDLFSADADSRVKLASKSRAESTRANRSYDDLGILLLRDNVENLYMRRVKSDEKAYVIRVKEGMVADNNPSGVEVFDPLNNKWVPIGLLAQIAKAIMKTAVAAQLRDSAEVDAWRQIKIANPDERKGAQSIGAFYDEGGLTEDEDTEE